MTRAAHRAADYPPINTPKQVADNLWIVDGPRILFGMPWPKMPFPTRTTIVRCPDGLFVHSPTRLTPALKTDVEALGAPRWIIGPNRLHYSWIPEWHRAFPHAAVYLAARIKERAGDLIDFPCALLTAGSNQPWEPDLATLAVAGSYLTEFVFFHHASRTLILTDLIENFEPDKLGSLAMRWLTRLGGVQDPNGGMPRDMRLTFAKPRLKAAIEQMIAWDPERVIFSHGRWYHTDGAKALRRAFRWLLPAT